MRSLLAVLILSFGVAVMTVQRVGAADQPVKVTVNNKPVNMNPTAIVRNGTTYVPLRQGTEALGGKVKWDAQTQSAQISGCGKPSTIRASQGIMVNGSLLLPLRALGRALSCKVAWDAQAQTVRITKPTGG